MIWMREGDNDSSMLAQFPKKFCSPKALAAYPYPHDNRLLPSQIVTLLLIHKQLCLLSGIVSCGYSVLSGHQQWNSKPQNFVPIVIVIFSAMEQSPPLSGGGQP